MPWQLDLGMPVATFLAEYWQQRPLLIRQGFKDFSDPISPEELAGLACEPEVESRLIVGSLTQGWELRHGPFQEEDFSRLPAIDWTLLVQDLDKHLPQLCELLEPFRFIPDWRIDDLMASYAPKGGSVGPHVDSYDVFLVQGLGQRRWDVAERQSQAPLLPDLPLKILADFQPTQGWELHAGDILYLPPGVPHHGVALEPCLTYSVGFRSPSAADLIIDLAHSLAADLDPDWRYTDPDLQIQSNPGELHPRAVQRVRQLLDQALALDDQQLADWFARVVSSPKVEFSARPLDNPFSLDELQAELAAGEALERNPGSRFVYRDSPLSLYLDGHARSIPEALRPLVQMLCQHRRLAQGHLSDWLLHPQGAELLLELINQGYLLIYDEDVP